MGSDLEPTALGSWQDRGSRRAGSEIQQGWARTARGGGRWGWSLGQSPETRSSLKTPEPFSREARCRRGGGGPVKGNAPGTTPQALLVNEERTRDSAGHRPERVLRPHGCPLPAPGQEVHGEGR